MSKGVLIPRIRLTLFSCAFLSCSSVRMNQSLVLPSSILPSCSSSFSSSSASSFVLSCPFGLSAAVCRLHEPSSIHELQGFVVPYGRVTGSFEYQARFQSFLRTRKNYSWERLQVSHTSTMHTVWVPLRVPLGPMRQERVSVCDVNQNILEWELINGKTRCRFFFIFVFFFGKRKRKRKRLYRRT